MTGRLIIISDGSSDRRGHVLLLHVLLQGHFRLLKATSWATKSYKNLLSLSSGGFHSSSHRRLLLPQQVARLHRIFQLDAMSTSFRRVREGL
jgi:hypothetical protein